MQDVGVLLKSRKGTHSMNNLMFNVFYFKIN